MNDGDPPPPSFWKTNLQADGGEDQRQLALAGDRAIVRLARAASRALGTPTGTPDQ